MHNSSTLPAGRATFIANALRKEKRDPDAIKKDIRRQEKLLLKIAKKANYNEMQECISKLSKLNNELIRANARV